MKNKHKVAKSVAIYVAQNNSIVKSMKENEIKIGSGARQPWTYAMIEPKEGKRRVEYFENPAKRFKTDVEA